MSSVNLWVGLAVDLVFLLGGLVTLYRYLRKSFEGAIEGAIEHQVKPKLESLADSLKGMKGQIEQLATDVRGLHDGHAGLSERTTRLEMILLPTNRKKWFR